MSIAKDNITAALSALAAVPARAVKAAATAIEARWKADWRSSKDPYGRAWKALAPYTVRKRGSSQPILIHTGAMIAGARVIALAKSGLALTVPFPGGLHQTGTVNMPARKVVPYMGIPRSWDSILKRAVKEAYKR